MDVALRCQKGNCNHTMVLTEAMMNENKSKAYPITTPTGYECCKTQSKGYTQHPSKTTVKTLAGGDHASRVHKTIPGT